tara:strand:+ start:5141 stop:6931 length:1791 start_codon:yes stop_codon:yes gene_type:complete
MATKAQSSYPLPGVTLPNVDYGAYSQPTGGRGQVAPPASAMVNVLQQGDKLRQLQEAERKREKELEDKENQALIDRMQLVQTNADLWNLQQMSDLNTIPQTSAVQDQLEATLHKRLDIATQAQVYLKTQHGDKEKRKSAQKAVSDYYDLLALTKNTITNFTALGSYWEEKAPTIGSAITIIGNDENEIANNQYFVNALGGVYDDANFEIVYDEEKNDVMIKVSGYEHELKDGVMAEGPYREKIMSARAFNARTGEGKDFGFVSSVPQVVNETIKKLVPQGQTPEGDGLGILNQKGIISDDYWVEDMIVTENLNAGYTKTSLRKKLNVEAMKKAMQPLLKQKVAGLVKSGPQQLANFWNIDLKKLNEGFANSYQKLLPNNQEMEEALFNSVLDSLTNYDGITKDDDGNIFMETNTTLSKPSKITPLSKPEGYRSENVRTAVFGEGFPILQELLTRHAPTKTYMTIDQMYQELPKQKDETLSKELGRTVTIQERYERDFGKDKWKKEYDKYFAAQDFKDGLYLLVSGEPRYAGDYNFDSHEDRFNFLLNQMTASERSKYKNTDIRLEAKKLDWQAKNPKKTGESNVDYAKRMNKALKI